MTRTNGSALRRRAGLVLRLVIVVVGIVAAALAGRGLLDRAIHAPRYATSGRATIAPDAYVVAARRVLPSDARIARLALPHGGGPVIVAASPATSVYLDPPTARVLDVASAAPAEDAATPAFAAQPLASVIARARPYANGALGSVDWPTQRSPDWTIGFGDAGTQVKVADDSGTARAAPVRQPSGAARLANRLGHEARGAIAWQVAIFLTGMIVALLAMIGIMGTLRPR